MELEPSRVRVATVGTYTLRIRVGEEGVEPGGGFLVDFPKAWMGLLNPLPKPLQQEDPEEPHHLGLAWSRREAKLSAKAESLALSGKRERYPHVVRIAVASAALQPGDEVEVRLANTAAPYLAGPGSVRVAVDPRGNGTFRLLEAAAPYEVRPGPAVKAILFSPSQAVTGREAEVQVGLFDRFHNPATRARGEVRLWGLGGEPRTVPVEGQGRVRLPWTPEEPGFLWPEAEVILNAPRGERRLEARGGPVRVLATEPRERVFWGDLQSHSRISKDGIGGDHFAYAREVSRLDFFAATEHSDDDGRWGEKGDGITPAEWGAIVEAVESHHQPGRFVTLLGYECTLRRGHHNVYFRTAEGVPVPPQDVGSVQALWRRLSPGDAITIPHHLGRLTRVLPRAPRGPRLRDVVFAPPPAGRGPAVDWSEPHDPVLRPLLEIYSIHGSSEMYAPADPLSYERVGYLPSRSSATRNYARAAWIEGHRIGVIASSDNHTAQPGLPHTGLAAVWAPELSREALFQAMTARRSYGTTGERVLLDLEVAGILMGGEGAARAPHQGRVLVAAPRELRHAEVLAVEAGSRKWRTVARWEDPGRLLEASFTHRPERRRGILYYLRAELRGRTGRRVSRAWSSPVWIDPPDRRRDVQ